MTGNLTDRQFEILDLLTEGYSHKEIAYKLGISANTIEKHRAAVMRKTGSRCLADLFAYVEARKLTLLEGRIVELLTKGYTNKQVALEMNITESSVEKHRSNIMRKTKTNGLAGLIAYTRKHGACPLANSIIRGKLQMVNLNNDLKSSKLPELLKLYREHKGLEKRELAEMIGLTGTTLLEIERRTFLGANSYTKIVKWMTS